VQENALDNFDGVGDFVVVGFIGGVGGSLIHLLLLGSSGRLILQLITGRRAAI